MEGQDKEKRYYVSFVRRDGQDMYTGGEVINSHPFVWVRRCHSGQAYECALLWWKELTDEDVAKIDPVDASWGLSYSVRHLTPVGGWEER